MHDLLNRRVQVSQSVSQTGANGPIVFTSTGDKWVLQFGSPVAIQRYGIIFTVAKDASALVATLAVRPTAGSDTNRAVQDTMTDSATARAQGAVIERKVKGTNPNASTGTDGSLVNVAALQGEGIQVFPGQEAVFAVTTAAASTGSGFMYIDYIEYAAVPELLYQSTALNYTVVQL